LFPHWKKPLKSTTPSVLFVTPECAPLTKTGGLGDVSAALPAALRQAGVDIRVLLPGYPGVMRSLGAACELARLPEPAFPAGSRLLQGGLPGGVPLIVLDSPSLYQRGGGPYLDENGRDWHDNATRFGVFSRVAALLASGGSPLPWRAHVLHGNDWPAGIACAYLHHTAGPRAASVFTIHNLAFQGIFPRSLLAPLGLPESSFVMNGLEFYGSISFLKAALVYCDVIATVSPGYAREIQSDALGFGLGGLLRARSADLVGIANGIDVSIWNPATDRLIAEPYDRNSLRAKFVNREALQRRMKLSPEPDLPLIGVIGRFTEQKGVDLIAEAAAQIARLPAQLVALGTGDRDIEAAMRAAAARHPHRIAVRIEFSETLAHLIEAGADMFLMPSRFEPCGLNQMYSQRYGTPPVAHATGGLADTIADCTEATLADGTATGFLFHQPNASSMMQAVRRAVMLFHDRPRWQQIQHNGMSRDFSWSAPADRYAAIYASLARTKDR
jgi:starch synthase